MEYKAERASVPTKFTLRILGDVWRCLNSRHSIKAVAFLREAENNAVDVREVSDIQYVMLSMYDKQEAMNRIEEILTCGGRIYDEFSGFLRKEKANANRIEEKVFTRSNIEADR